MRRRAHHVVHKASIALAANSRQSPPVTVPFNQFKLQQATNVRRLKGIVAGVANLAKRRFFVGTEQCKNGPHMPPLYAHAI
jgi:hypothetical protein